MICSRLGGRTFGVRRCGRGRKHGRTHVRHPPMEAPLEGAGHEFGDPGGDALKVAVLRALLVML